MIRHAIREYREGRTKTIEEYTKEHSYLLRMLVDFQKA